MNPSESNYPINKYPCNAYNAYNAYNGINERRVSQCIRIRPSIHKAVGSYCHDTRMNIGEFYEEAALTYFQINPPPERGGEIIIVRDSGVVDKSVEDRMTELICIGELEAFLDGMRRSHRVNGIHHSKIKKLKVILSECEKIPSRGDELNGLIKEAVEYVR